MSMKEIAFTIAVIYLTLQIMNAPYAERVIIKGVRFVKKNNSPEFLRLAEDMPCL